jgi:anti-sigma regulatory factor (Ser/Thr protein kinase)
MSMGQRSPQDLTVSFSVANAPRSVREARRRIAPLRDELGERLHQDLGLLLSELVGNAVRHANLGKDDRVQVRVECRPGWVRAEVADPGAGFLVGRTPSPEASGLGGYGLTLVSRLANRWGAARDDGSMRVWFELDASA